MKSTFITAFALLFILGNAFSQTEFLTFETKKGKVEYLKVEGRFHGLYTSYYLSGAKKAEGNFENNYRTGVWTIWNEAGEVILKKEYFSPFVTNLADAVSVKEYDYKKNTDGFIDYYPLVQENVAWSKRIWRTLDKKNNPLLFGENTPFDIYFNLGVNGEITLYDPSDDEFGTKLDLEQAVQTDPENTSIIGYKIKEEFFYDRERQVMETRIIGICPLAQINKKGKTQDLFWVYFPEVRKYMGFVKLNNPALPEKIESLDDLFFYHYYSGQITESSNTMGNTIAELIENKDEQIKESEKIDLGIIEAEHEQWLKNK